MTLLKKILVVCLIMFVYCALSSVDVYGYSSDDSAKTYRDSAKGDKNNNPCVTSVSGESIVF